MSTCVQVQLNVCCRQGNTMRQASRRTWFLPFVRYVDPVTYLVQMLSAIYSSWWFASCRATPRRIYLCWVNPDLHSRRQYCPHGSDCQATGKCHSGCSQRRKVWRGMDQWQRSLFGWRISEEDGPSVEIRSRGEGLKNTSLTIVLYFLIRFACLLLWSSFKQRRKSCFSASSSAARPAAVRMII